MANIYKLIIQSGKGTGTEYPLEKNELFLGRDLTSDLVINDPEVSRRHLRLVLDGASYRMEDLGSTNGTFIHGQRLSTPVLLKPGEVISLGEKIVLRFEVINTDPNATVVVQRGVSSSTQEKPRPVAPPISAPVAPPVAAPPPAQAYQPISPAPVYAAPNIQVPPSVGAPKKKSSALIVILILVGIILLFCVVPWIIIDMTNSYCSLFPGILNMFITNACPI